MIYRSWTAQGKPLHFSYFINFPHPDIFERISPYLLFHVFPKTDNRSFFVISMSENGAQIYELMAQTVSDQRM